MVHAIVACVADDAKNLTPCLGLARHGIERTYDLQSREAELTIQRIVIRPVPPDEALIYERDEITARIFRFIPGTAVKQWDAEGCEVIRTDGVDTNRLVFATWDTADVDRGFFG